MNNRTEDIVFWVAGVIGTFLGGYIASVLMDSTNSVILLFGSIAGAACAVELVSFLFKE